MSNTLSLHKSSYAACELRTKQTLTDAHHAVPAAKATTSTNGRAARVLAASSWTQWQLASRSGRILPNIFLAQKQKKSRMQRAAGLLEC